MRRADLMVKLVLGGVIACLFILGLSFVAAVDARSGEESIGQGLYLIKSDEQGIVLELRTSNFHIEEMSVEDTVYQALRVRSYAFNDQAGHPQLPLQGALLGIPPNAQLELRILEAEGDMVVGSYNISPVPRLIVRFDPSSDLPEDPVSELVQDAGVYSVNAFYPADLAHITSSGFMRDQRFLSLQVYPFQYNPVTREVKFYQRVRVEISFSYPDGGPSVTASGEIGGPFESGLRNTILNYESARAWRQRSRGAGLLEASVPWSCDGCYKMTIGEEGIYELGYWELKGKGVPVDPPIDPRNFHIYNRGEEIAIYVHQEEDEEFEDGDYILFYGEEVNTKYTNTNIYWFAVDGTPGKRMGTKPEGGAGSTPDWFEATARVEEDHFYYTWLPHAEAEHWYWEYLQTSGKRVTETYTINLSNIHVGEAYSATLRSDIWGATLNDNVDPDHHALVYVNDYLAEDAWWDGKTGYHAEAQIPSFVLLEGDNVIKVVCPGDTGAGDEVAVTDWFEIIYRDTHVAEGDSLAFNQDGGDVWEYQISNFSEPSVEAYDVTEPISVSRIITRVTLIDFTWTLTFTQEIISPARYLAQTEAERKSPIDIVEDVPSNLGSPLNGAEYLIITHSDFYANVLALRNHRAAQGYSTMVVDVEDIYDEFNYGLFDAQAIRDFLVYTYESSWDPTPSYVLLVGDGNYDFKDNKGHGEPNYVPPYLACLDPFESGCEIAADNRYVCVSGTDNMPDMYIGRLPVKTPDEADAVIDKILDYETSPLSDGRRQTLFVADNPDDAGDFRALSDYIADNHLPSFYSAERVYYKVSPHTTPGDVTTAIIGAINEGRLLVNYFGHGYVSWWGAEMFFDQTNWAGLPHRLDLDLLTNSERFPLVVSMSCYVSNFVHPSSLDRDLSSLSESLVRAEGKGAVATWGSVGLGEGEGHRLLDSGFFTAVFTHGVVEVGAATIQAAWGMPSYQYLVDQYVLFGDPAMRLGVRQYRFLPLAVKGY